MNARFWTWENGWVKITLQPGQTLHHSRSSRDEEGWSRTQEMWTHDGDRVTRRWSDEGRDCDGFIRRTGSNVCPISRLATVPAYDDGSQDFRPMEGRPDWQDVESQQYDERAIAANY